MRRTSVLVIIASVALGGASYSTVRAQQAATRSASEGIYSAEQSKRGETVYADGCAGCHDPALAGGIGPALAGKEFLAIWEDLTVGDLFERIKTLMPLNSPGSLTGQQTADVVAFILSFNKFPAGKSELATDVEPLKAIKLVGAAAPAARAAGTGLYAEAQAKRGETQYADACAACHDAKLTGGIGPPLAGAEFIAAWKDRSVGDLFDTVKELMPLSSPGSLTPQQASDILAFMLSANRYPAGSAELSTDVAALKAVPLGEPPK